MELVLRALNNNEVVVSICVLRIRLYREHIPTCDLYPPYTDYKDNDIFYANTFNGVCVCLRV